MTFKCTATSEFFFSPGRIHTYFESVEHSIPWTGMEEFRCCSHDLVDMMASTKSLAMSLSRRKKIEAYYLK